MATDETLIDRSSEVAIVTGASAGIGRAAAAELAARGVRVGAIARGAERLTEVAATLNAEHGEARVAAIVADVSTADGCERAVAETRAQLGPVTMLINNAGSSSAHPFLETSDEVWHEDLELKLHAAVRLTRSVVPDMQASGGGSIINILNTAAKAPDARTTPTSVSRAAGLALTKALSKEYATDQIRVNAVMIGLVKSGQWERRHDASATDQSLDEFYAAMGARVPLGRVAEAEEAASLIGFLSSPQGAYITGASINFDGGMSAVV